jgi:hypothetical protein
MTTWIPVDTMEMNPEKKLDERGVELHVQISPYDVPQALRGGFNEKTDRFEIEFRYIGDEPLRVQAADQHVSFYVGKKSGRLYKIQLNVKAMKAQKVTLKLAATAMLSQEIEKLNEHIPGRRDNYGVVSDLIKSKSDDINRLLSGRMGLAY